jgi:hypothetical protein
VLVAAVLRPEEGEDGELEVVRVSAEQLPDTVRFPVGETKDAVEGLILPNERLALGGGPGSFGGQLRQVIQCNRVGGGISRHPDAFRFTG